MQINSLEFLNNKESNNKLEKYIKRFKKKFKVKNRNKNIKIEEVGIYNKYKYSIIFGRMGYRCAYIEVPKDSLLYLIEMAFLKNVGNQYFFDCNYDYNLKFNPMVHGGVNFSKFNKDRSRGLGKTIIIGWDYGHYMDRFDVETTKKYFPKMDISKHFPMALTNSDYKDWSFEEVKKQAKDCINYIIKFEKDLTSEQIDVKKKLYKLVYKQFKKYKKITKNKRVTYVK